MNTMAFFDDMSNALDTYPATNIVIKIIDVTLPPTGTVPNNVLNVGEQATFKVKVTNTGPLTLTGLKVHLKGLSGATLLSPIQVFGKPPIFIGEFVTGAFPDIGGDGDSKTIGPFTFKAPTADSKDKPEDLLKATLDAWDAKLDPMLTGHSNKDDAVNDIYSREVVAS
jgi:hypothetical protein